MLSLSLRDGKYTGISAKTIVAAMRKSGMVIAQIGINGLIRRRLEKIALNNQIKDLCLSLELTVAHMQVAHL